jgi:hypothetical protein
LALFTNTLDKQAEAIEKQLQALFQNANQSDSQIALKVQVLGNAWTVVTTVRTQMGKAIGDALKQIANNV